MGIKEPRTLAPSELKPLFRIHAQLCKALANEHRLAILYALSQGEKRVSDLAGELDLSIHNVSQQLGVLRERGVITSRREGQNVLCSVTNPKFIQACTLIRQALVEHHRSEGTYVLTAEVMDAIERMSLPGEADQDKPR